MLYFSEFVTIRCMTHKHSSALGRTNKIALFRIALEMVQWIFFFDKFSFLNMNNTMTKNMMKKKHTHIHSNQLKNIISFFLWHYMSKHYIIVAVKVVHVVSKIGFSFSIVEIIHFYIVDKQSFDWFYENIKWWAYKERKKNTSPSKLFQRKYYLIDFVCVCVFQCSSYYLLCRVFTGKKIKVFSFFYLKKGSTLKLFDSIHFISNQQQKLFIFVNVHYKNWI